jgi:hypothetical protein
MKTLHVGLVAVLLTLGSVSAAHAEEPSKDPAVTFTSGSVVKMCGTCLPRLAQLAVTPRNNFVVRGIPPEEPSVDEISFGSERKAPDLVKVTWVLSSDGSPVALALAVDSLAPDLKPGTYDVLLNLRPQSAPREPRLKLQVVQGPGKLDLPEKLLVVRTWWLPFYRCDRKMPLRIRETSSDSRLTDLRVESRQTMIGASAIMGGIAIRPSDLAGIGASGTLRDVPYNLTGPFPLGLAAGSLRFSATGLSEPVILPFEVRSGLPPFYLLLAIVFGLWLSWYVKVRLERTIQLSDAIDKSDELLARINSNRRDLPFQNDLAEPIDALERAASRTDIQDIAAKRTALDAAWREALKSFAIRRAAAQQSFDALRSLAETPWRLPSDATALVERLRSELESIRRLLVQDDAQAATARLAQVQGSFFVELGRVAHDWQEALLAYLKQLADPALGIPASVSKEFAALYEKERPSLSRIGAASPSDLGTAMQLVRDLDNEYGMATQWLGEFGVSMLRAQVEFSAVAARGSGSQPSQAVQAFRDHLSMAADHPATAAEQLPERLGTLQAAWREAILGLAPDPKTLPAGLDALVAARDFLGAARLATGKSTILGPTGAPAPPPLFSGTPVTSPSPAVVSSPPSLFIPDRLSPLRIVSASRIQAAKLKLTIILGVLLTALIYSTYGATYDGSWSGLFAVFFVAFASDMTLDSVLGKVRGGAPAAG